MNYPPIDPYFYELSANGGMTEAQIEEDWHAFIDGLNEFHSDVDRSHMENPPMPEEPKTLRDLATEIVSKLLPTPKEPKHAHP